MKKRARIYTAAFVSIAVMTGCGGGAENSASGEQLQEATAIDEGGQDIQEKAQAVGATWNKIASEWAGFSVDGARKVRFGANGNWIEKVVSGSATCSNAFFGRDPAPMVLKSCEVETAVTAEEGWTTIAREWAYFKLDGTRTVRYGADTRWVQKSVKDSGNCTNQWFGMDPAPTVVKSCQVLDAVDTVELWKKPFATTSPWNSRIPANATYASGNDPRVTSFRNVSDSYKLRVNTDRWTQWVYRATVNDPLMTVHVSVRNLDNMRHEAQPREGVVTLRAPAAAKPDAATWVGFNNDPWADLPDGKDAHMTIIDPDGLHAHEFWHIERDRVTGAFKAVSYSKVPLKGEGIFIVGSGVQAKFGNYFNPAFLTYGWGATRAYGGSSMGGLIRQGEITQGPLEHALFMSIPQEILGYPADGQVPLYPASSDDGRSHGYTGNILMGTRFAIPRNVNLASLGLSPAGLRLATALQEYGAFVSDQSGGVRLNSEGTSAQADGNALNNQDADLRKIHALLTIVNP